MSEKMLVVDAHRLVGHLPHTAGTWTTDELVADLDRLDIDHAAVVASWDLYGDPRDAANYESRAKPIEPSDRITRVAVHIPGHPHSAIPSTASLVRIAPSLHRFDLFGKASDRSLSALAERSVAIAIDATEVGIGVVGQLARRHPALKIFVLNPGYRDLLRVAELLGPKVWVESGTLIAAGAIEWLSEVAGSDRIVFGSGAPLRDAAGARYTLDMLDLPLDARQDIASRNWERMVSTS